MKRKKKATTPVQHDLFGNPIDDRPRAAAAEMIPLAFESEAVRMVLIRGVPWWVAADVCRVLGISNPSKAISRLDEEDRTTLTNSEGGGRAHSLNVVNESGLYSLLMTSRKPEARRFKRWITSEVIPTIRRTGTFALPTSRLARVKRKLRCDDATAKERCEQYDANRATNRRLQEAGASPRDFQDYHNAGYEGQFGPGMSARRLRAVLQIPGHRTPLDFMGQVPLAINSLAKAIAAKLIEDSPATVPVADRPPILRRVAEAVTRDSLAKLGRESGDAYLARVVEDPRRGRVIDVVRNQLPA